MSKMQVGMLEDGSIDCFPVGSNDVAVVRFNNAANPSGNHPWMVEWEQINKTRKAMSLRTRITDGMFNNVLQYAKGNIKISDIDGKTKKKLHTIEWLVSCFHGDYEVKQTDQCYPDLLECYIQGLKEIRAQREAKKPIHSKRCSECGHLIKHV